jgi:hypothetical protein
MALANYAGDVSFELDKILLPRLEARAIVAQH